MSFTSKAVVCLFGLSLGLTACSTTRSSVDDALLERLTARERAEISESRESRDRAAAEWDSAKDLVREADQDVEIARSGLKIARAQLEQAELLVKKSDSGSVPEMTAARVGADWHRARVDASRAGLDYAKARRAWARATAKHAESRLELCEARLELEKVRAVRELHGVDDSKLELEKFERSLAEREQSSKLSQTRVTKAKETADRALAERNAAMERASALTP